LQHQESRRAAAGNSGLSEPTAVSTQERWPNVAIINGRPPLELEPLAAERQKPKSLLTNQLATLILLLTRFFQDPMLFMVPQHLRPMKKSLFLIIGVILLTAWPGPGQTWMSYLDGSSLPGTPWQPFSNEGTTMVVPIDGMNNALRMDSSEHNGGTGTRYNEWYVGAFVLPELVGAARFRLVDFSATGKENLLAVTVGGGAPTAPSITLVDGHFMVWSYTTDQPIFDLGPAVADEWHTAYILARNNGTAQVWWDGALVVDGAVPVTPSFDGYVEFGSGTYWQTTAATTVDFDWVGFGDANVLPQSLRIERAGGQVVVSWPSHATEFVLQCTTNLTPAAWVDVTDTAGNVYTNDLVSTTQFYRLRRIQ